MDYKFKCRTYSIYTTSYFICACGLICTFDMLGQRIVTVVLIYCSCHSILGEVIDYLNDPYFENSLL